MCTWLLKTAKTNEVVILSHNLYHYTEEVVQAMCMTANELGDLTNEKNVALPVFPVVIASCVPQTTVRVIDALHHRQKFCFMTGDGVNDSSSLKTLYFGVAMCLNGFDVAKDASDIV